MKEYQICYTINDKGYTRDLPWIYDLAQSEEEAKSMLEEAHIYLSYYNSYSVWVNVRQVTDWTRVDLT
jgi:hypothetical protein